jgi:hypothetical protein
MGMREDGDGTGQELLAQINPIDAAQLASTWSASRASEALFEEITMTTTINPTHDEPSTVVPFEAPRRRPRRTLRIASAAAVAVLAVVLGLLPGTSDASYAVRLRPDGIVQVDWHADLRDGAAITEELRSHGLDIAVEVVPSSPSMVGSVLVAIVDGVDPDDERPAGITWGDDGAEDVFTWTIDPAVFTGSITVELAVAAKPGEAYLAAEEVFEPGEALGGLHCSLGTPLRARDVASHADGLELRWSVATLVNPDDPTILQETIVDAVPDGEVLWGYALDDATVALTVRPDGADLGPDFQPRLSDVPC